MKISKNMIHSVGLALSFPSMIFATAYFFMTLVDKGVISKLVGVLLFLAVIVNTLVLIVVYALKKKNGNTKED